MATEDPVEVKVLFFGRARELMDCDERRACLPRNVPYHRLKELIFEEIFKDLNAISSSCVLAVDQKYVNDNKMVKLNEFSEVAIIPPLSGG
ncbi:hypothetical protein KIN20_015517 [Parelaphostrongylus tenuis]|uniref:Molybdopterin synthase sulfur carrier subunit n=1 Tax=Parelaphostrongylus tenuis TaxID=148309 RepID=A0AAD5MXH0_PARTN|nr:hypothetical protein KIN20_015517 [Parelaphostrongylus tenuis]